MPSPRQRCAWLWVGAFLTSLLGGLVAPSRTMAECGSHAVAPSQQVGSGRFSHLSSLLRGTPADQGTMPTAPAAPCRGPGCSRGPVHEPLPAPSLRSVHGERWCCLDTPELETGPGPAAWPLDEGRVRSSHRSQVLDRPPRPLPNA